jgi:hexosaminidase
LPNDRTPVPDLFPRPQHMEVHGAGAPLDAPVRELQDASLPAEGYQLDIHGASDGDKVVLRHRDGNGLRYGRATLDQLRAQSADRGELPGLRIRDWPDFPVRGFLLDISRDRVPTRATLERFVGLMALARINQFQLYTEHTFAYRDHEVVWRDASPITADDVRWLDELCRAHGIELVPNQNCFGHMNRWLQHDAYHHRAEAPEGYELIPGVWLPASVFAPTDDNAAFAHRLFDELLPNFTSRQVNVGFDEPFELGTGASRAEVEERGRAAVYLDHLRRIAIPLVEQGREVQFCADVLRHAPRLADRVPDRTMALAWTYEAPPVDDERPVLLPEIAHFVARAGATPEDHMGFEANVAPLVETGMPFWVLPGTSSWNSLVGRIDNAVANLLDAADVGLARGASGYLITDWGDNGHLQPPSISFGPLLFGGAVSWALSANRDLDIATMLDRHVFLDASRNLGPALDDLGRVWNATGQRAFNASPLQAALAPHQLHLVDRRPDPAKVRDVVERIDAAIAAIGRSTPQCVDGDVVRDELRTAARLARLGAFRLVGRTEHDEMDEVIGDQRRSWLARSRPGGLADSLVHLEWRRT